MRSYTREEGCRAWLTYALMPAEVLSQLLQEFGSAEAIYDRFTKSGAQFLTNRISKYGIDQLLAQADRRKMHEMLVIMQKNDIGIIGQDDSSYPDSLRNIPSPPALLFYRGNLDCLMGKCVSVVGARNASSHGVDMTETICRELSEAGVTIVSGLAAGIDAAAHEGCLAGGSPTAAVLGCGINVDYPAENYELKERIVRKGGVVLSEYPLDARANKFVFQLRNRLISGLGKALILMESRIQSGSMLTVQHALDQGREVYAFPGIPGSEWAEGAHQLLREGANYFTGAQDILEDLGWEEKLVRVPETNPAPHAALTDEQRSVFSLLSQGEMSFDEIAVKSGLPVPSITVALTMLQMNGLVKALPGKCYCRI